MIAGCLIVCVHIFAGNEDPQDILMTRDGADADTADHLSSFCWLWPERAPGLHWQQLTGNISWEGGGEEFLTEEEFVW